MQEDYSQFIDKLKIYMSKKINVNTSQNLNIDNIMATTIGGWRGLGTEQSIRYGGGRDRAQYTIGNNTSSPPIVSA